jgi:hypothetical protein
MERTCWLLGQVKTSMKATKALLGILTISLALVGQVQAQSFLTNGLVAYYPFDGNANDVTGNGNNGIVCGPTLTADRYGNTNSAYFAASHADYITTTTRQSPINLFTISIWFKTLTDGTFICYLGTQNNVANPTPGTTIDRAVGIAQDGTGRLLGYVYPGSPQHVFSVNRYDDDSWHQAVLTVSPVGMLLYADGIAVGTNAAATSAEQTASWWTMGQQFIGSLDGARIYNCALSPSEVQQLFVYEFGPRVNLIKAVKPSFSNLTLTTNYQLQVSADMNTWTNQGSAFTATNASMVYPQYWDVDNWGQLFFRLQVSP